MRGEVPKKHRPANTPISNAPDFLNAWTLTFSLKAMQDSGLLGEDNFIDPAKLKNVEMILAYQVPLFGPKGLSQGRRRP